MGRRRDLETEIGKVQATEDHEVQVHLERIHIYTASGIRCKVCEPRSGGAPAMMCVCAMWGVRCVKNLDQRALYYYLGEAEEREAAVQRGALLQRALERREVERAL